MSTNVGRLVATLSLDNKAFTQSLSTTERKMLQFGNRATRLGKNLSVTVTAPLVAAGVAAVRFGESFETEMTKIETLVGVSRDQVQAWEKDILALGPAVGKGPGELAKALFVVTSAGERGANALSVVENAAKASAIGLGDTADVARAVTSAMQTWKDEGLSATRATEILISTVREGNLEASALATSLGRVQSIAAQVGVTFEEVGAFVATFTRFGVSAEEAVTALRGTLNSVIAPSTETEEALASIGLSAETLKQKIADEGLAKVLVDLVGQFDGNATAVAKLIPNVRALSGVLANAGRAGDVYVQIAKNIKDSNGILDEGFERVKETAEQARKEFLATAEVVAIEFSKSVLPVYTDWLKKIAELSVGLSENSALVIAATVAAAALGPVLVLVGTGVRAVVSGLAILAPLLGATSGGLGAALVLISVGWVKVNGLMDKAQKKFRVTGNEADSLASKLRGTTEQVEFLSRGLKVLTEQEQVVKDIRAISNEIDELKFAIADAEAQPVSGAVDAFLIGASEKLATLESKRVALLGALEKDITPAAVKEEEEGGGGGGGGVDQSAIDKQRAALQSLNEMLSENRLRIREVKEGDLAGELARGTAEMLKQGVEAGITGDKLVNDFIVPWRLGIVELHQLEAEQGLTAILDGINERTDSFTMDPIVQESEKTIEAWRRLGSETQMTQEKIDAGVVRIEESFQRLSKAANKTTIDVGSKLAGAFRGTISGILQGTRDAEDVVKQFADTAIATVEDMFVSWLESKINWEIAFEDNLLGKGVDIVKDWASGAIDAFAEWGKAALSWIKDVIVGLIEMIDLQLVLNAVKAVGGGVLGLIGLADGGVVTGPTPAIVGEAGPEAVIPLERLDKMIGRDGNGEGGNMTVIVNSPEASASTEESEGPDGQRMLEVNIERIFTQQVASGGPIADVQEQYYGARRSGVRR